MIVGTKLNIGKELTKYKETVSYLNPKYVYIPLVSGKDKNITLVVKKGDYVYKGSIIGKSKGNFRIPICSSVSGTVVDFVEMSYLDGTIVKCVKIENDFKDQPLTKVEPVSKISKYSKEDFIKVLQTCGVIGMGGAGFSTYVKYNSDKKIDTLIVNAIECEPYITANYVQMKDRMEDILEVTDAVMEINGIKEGFIAVNKSYCDIIKKFHNYLGTYPKIKVVGVKDIYPVGYERIIVSAIKKVEYHSLPIEKGIVVNNVLTMLAIYDALKFHKHLVERVITVTGDCLPNATNILVKFGTRAEDILNEINSKVEDSYRLIAGGPMLGHVIDNNDLVVTANLNCIYVSKKGVEQSVECIRCGKCTGICPTHLSPVLIKDSLDNLKRLKSLKANRCIECGLCSYICPSKIILREITVEAKNKLMSGRK